jgi:hypothetical protein
MEAFLNLLWVLIALGALGAWRGCWMREQREGRRDPIREWAAVVCALVLLFFAVSLSDDLHASPMLLDESAGGRRHSMMRNAGQPAPDSSSHVAAHSVALNAGCFLASPSCRFVSIALFEDVRSISLLTGVSSGRAPPLTSL